MAKFYCFSTLLAGKKKKVKELDVNRGVESKPTKKVEKSNTNCIEEEKTNIQAEEKTSKDGAKELIQFDEKLHGKSAIEAQDTHESTCMSKQKDIDVIIPEEGYKGDSEHDENLSRRKYSDFDLQTQDDSKCDSISNGPKISFNHLKNAINSDDGSSEIFIDDQCNINPDPGMWQASSRCEYPKLNRSCSNIETRNTAQPLLLLSKSLSYDDLGNVKGKTRGNFSFSIPNSPLSAISSCSADKVMLKKQPSCQILPSRSKKLWLKLFLWGHRNLHKSWASKSSRLFPVCEASDQKGDDSCDTLEPNNSSNKDEENQWVAFSVEASPFERVNAWVNALDNVSNHDVENGEEFQEKNFDFTSHEIGESSHNNKVQDGYHIAEKMMHTNKIRQSLNSLSTGIHICAKGLKVLPAISAFSGLRSVNLSNNFIVHITPGALPKNLHTLDLSRNRITSIEGLRELTHLRVLNMSYNRISRIGRGLSNSTLIKELYLAGNKISNVEGLHRLLKLNLLDLSFNKITTIKYLGQLVANHNTLLALNILGNPIESNMGKDQLRKEITGLLPSLIYLNKQPIKPQRATELVTNSIARAALGDGGSRRRTVRRANAGSGSSSFRGRTKESSIHGGQSKSRSRHTSKTRH